MMTSLSMLKRAPHMSVSQVKAFTICPRRYALQYVDREPPDFRSAALALGTAWHLAIGRWISGEVEGEPLEAALRDEIHRELHAENIPVLFDDADEDEERFIAKATAMLRAFVAAVRKPDRVLGVEIPFSSEMVHPVSGEVMDLPVIGALDALVVDGGQTRLWELKTSARKYGTDQLEFDWQTVVYRKAVRELGFGEVPPRLLVTTKTKLPSVQVVDLDRSQVDETEMIELFLSVRRAVKSGVDHRLRSWACRSCPFAGACR